MIDPVDHIDAATDAAVKLVSARLPDIIRQHMGEDMPFSAVVRASANKDGHAAAGHTRSAIMSSLQAQTEQILYPPEPEVEVVPPKPVEPAPNFKAVEKLARKKRWDFVMWTWAADTLVVIFEDENKIGVLPGDLTAEVTPLSEHLWPFCNRDDVNAILDRMGEPLSIGPVTLLNVGGTIEDEAFSMAHVTFKLNPTLFPGETT